MKYQAIIFDWDGTLMDSAQRIVESMELAAKDVGLDVRTPYEIRQIIGLGLPEAIIHLWQDLENDPLTIEEMRARHEAARRLAYERGRGCHTLICRGGFWSWTARSASASDDSGLSGRESSNARRRRSASCGARGAVSQSHSS